MHLLPLLLSACDPTASIEPLHQLPGDQLAPPMALQVGPLVPGQPLTLRVDGAPPRSNVYFGRSGSPGQTCPPALGGACLDLAAPLPLVGTDVADASGVAELTLTLPATAPSGMVVYLQAGTYVRGTLYKTQVVTRVIGTSCSFGDLLAEVSRPGGMYDQDRVTHDDSFVYTSFSSDMYRFDVNLNQVGTPVSLPQAGNHGLSYSAFDDVIYNFDTARNIADISALDANSLVVVAAANTGDDTGGAFVDPAGHVHLVRRSGGSFVELDNNLQVVGTWGGGITGMDGEISANGRHAYHLDLANMVTVYDFAAVGRPSLGSFTIPNGGGTSIVDIAPDGAGNLYAVDRNAGVLHMYDADDGLQIASVSLGATSEPVAVDYHPGAHALYVAFYNGGSAVLRKYCAY